MTRKNSSRNVSDDAPANRPQGTNRWIAHLIDKGLDSITAAGPVAWIAVVCIAALFAVVLVVYIMAGAPPRTH
jgi:hypothetical protein